LLPVFAILYAKEKIMRLKSTRQKIYFRKESIKAGALAGLLGGILMMGLLQLLSAFSGMGFWHPLELNGGLLYGVDSILGGPGPVLTGLALHALATAALGMGFGALLPVENPFAAETGRAVGWGGMYGVAAWVIAHFLLLPLVNPTMHARAELASGWWFLSFLLLGLVLGITPVLRRALSHQLETYYQEEPRRAA
jgi:hypothetical protein